MLDFDGVEGEQKMTASNPLREDLEVCENYINDVPNIFDPCKLCVNWDEKTCYNEDCRECCWYYASKFKLKEKEVKHE